MFFIYLHFDVPYFNYSFFAVVIMNHSFIQLAFYKIIRSVLLLILWMEYCISNTNISYSCSSMFMYVYSTKKVRCVRCTRCEKFSILPSNVAKIMHTVANIGTIQTETSGITGSTSTRELVPAHQSMSRTQLLIDPARQLFFAFSFLFSFSFFFLPLPSERSGDGVFFLFLLQFAIRSAKQQQQCCMCVTFVSDLGVLTFCCCFFDDFIVLANYSEDCIDWYKWKEHFTTEEEFYVLINNRWTFAESVTFCTYGRKIVLSSRGTVDIKYGY